MTEHLLFDVTSNPFPWKIIEPPLIGMAVAVVGVVLARLDRLKPRALYLGIGYMMLVSAPLALLIASWDWFSLKRSFSQDLRAERCLTLEGPIESFRPMIPTGYQESFTVANHYFFYSDQNSFVANPCFRQTNLRNGPIREGLRVRIKFSGNCILQIQELVR